MITQNDLLIFFRFPGSWTPKILEPTSSCIAVGPSFSKRALIDCVLLSVRSRDDINLLARAQTLPPHFSNVLNLWDFGMWSWGFPCVAARRAFSNRDKNDECGVCAFERVYRPFLKCSSNLFLLVHRSLFLIFHKETNELHVWRSAAFSPNSILHYRCVCLRWKKSTWTLSEVFKLSFLTCSMVLVLKLQNVDEVAWWQSLCCASPSQTDERHWISAFIRHDWALRRHLYVVPELSMHLESGWFVNYGIIPGIILPFFFIRTEWHGFQT